MTPSLLELFLALSPLLDCAVLHGKGLVPQQTQRIAWRVLHLARERGMNALEQEALVWAAAVHTLPLKTLFRLCQRSIPCRTLELLRCIRQTGGNGAEYPSGVLSEAAALLALAQRQAEGEKTPSEEDSGSVVEKNGYSAAWIRHRQSCTEPLRKSCVREQLNFPAFFESTLQRTLQEALLPSWRRAAPWPQLVAAAFCLADSADERFPWTKGQTRRLLRLTLLAWHRREKASEQLADKRIRKQHLQELALAVCLHDLGMLAVPDTILTLPRCFAESEMLIVRGHVWWLWEALHSLRGLGRVSCWAAEHHERYDASGYPWGRQGKEISVEGALLACADCAQRLLDGTPRRKASSPRRVMLILEGMAAHGRLDPSAVKLLQLVLGKLYKTALADCKDRRAL